MLCKYLLTPRGTDFRWQNYILEVQFQASLGLILLVTQTKDEESITHFYNLKQSKPILVSNLGPKS